MLDLRRSPSTLTTMLTRLLLVFTLMLIPLEAAASEGLPEPFFGTDSPRSLVVDGASLPISLSDSRGLEVPLAARGAYLTGNGVEVWLPMLLPGEYTLSWPGGGMQLSLPPGDTWHPIFEESTARRATRGAEATAIALGLLLAAAGYYSFRKGRRTVALPLAASSSALLAVAFLGMLPPTAPEDACEHYESQDLRIDCVKMRVRYAMQAGGPSLAVAEVERLVADPSSSLRAQCHNFMHFTGRLAWEMFPDVEVLAEEGSVTCAFGFFHGIFEGVGMYSLDADLAQRIVKTCRLVHARHEGSADSNDGCPHGAGHAAMIRSGLDLEDALAFCSGFDAGFHRDECEAGAVMEWAWAKHRAGVVGDERLLPDPVMDDPFSLCQPPYSSANLGCFKSAMAALTTPESLISGIGGCVGPVPEAEEYCRFYSMAIIASSYAADVPRLGELIGELCTGTPWSDGPESCYRTFGHTVMARTRSFDDVQLLCSAASSSGALLESCTSGADDLYTRGVPGI